MSIRPDILAPAGNTESFLAGLAAGADAIYLGLKHFSARMQAENFSVKEIQNMTDLAHDKGRKVYLALNTLIKPNEPDQAGRLMARFSRDSRPDAVIIQDLGAIDLLRQAGFKGEIHLSTLSAVAPQAGLEIAAGLGAKRVILPRELSLDEIKTMSQACPDGLDLEMFIHGALCYCVSGRCLWSSFMGGKSGLRGRCVQPCRRLYQRKGPAGRLFSCLDLSLDVLTNTLLELPNLVCWKIEGRKKGPHYVYYTVSAYKLLRDHPHEAAAKKEALSLLERALGRTGTHFSFLPQRPHNPTQHDNVTDSGLGIGKVILDPAGRPLLKPRLALLSGDLLRVGSEEEASHMLVKIGANLPKGGTLTLNPPKGDKPPKSGRPVFLIDRREKELAGLIKTWGAELASRPERPSKAAPKFAAVLPKALARPERTQTMILRPRLPTGKAGKAGGVPALWLSSKSLSGHSTTLWPRLFWWLPPVIWPDEQEAWQRLIKSALRGGARRFVLNAPWQMALFDRADGLNLLAGPFCNIANGLHIKALQGLGFSGALVSPELAEADFLALPGQSPLPLGLVTSGLWPLGVSRIKPAFGKDGEAMTSPKAETHYTRKYGQNTWIYSNRPLDLTSHEPALAAAGYAWFVHVEEYLPKNVPEAGQPSTFNWDLELL